MGGPQTTTGQIHRVPCPFCKKPLDFRAHADAELGGAGWGNQGLETGSKVDCEHCGRTSKILAIEQITIVRLAPSTKG